MMYLCDGGYPPKTDCAIMFDFQNPNSVSGGNFWGISIAVYGNKSMRKVLKGNFILMYFFF